MSEASSHRTSTDGPSPRSPHDPQVDDMGEDLSTVSLEPDGGTSPPPPPPEKDEVHETVLDSPMPSTPPTLPVEVDAAAEERGDTGSPSADRASPVRRLRSANSSTESLSSRRHQSVEPLYLTTARSAHEKTQSRPSSQNSNRPSPPTTPLQEHNRSASGGIRAVSPGILMSPGFRTIDVHPSVSLDEDIEDLDPTAPFESVSLDDAPAPEGPREVGQTTPITNVRELPGTPNSALNVGHGHERTSSRTSWTGSIASAVVPNGVRRSESNPQPPSPTTPVSTTQASGSSTPRRHAPPAHPHPFPIPTSPLPANVPVPQVTDISAGPSKSPVIGIGGATVPTPGHALGVKGQSAFDKFMSRTRPSHLPPKDKAEDEEHLHEWESMMSKAREHETERRRIAEARQLEREKHLVAVTPRWEALLRDRDVINKVKSDKSNRELWFEGIPPHLRGRAWSLAIGNSLAMHKDAYSMYLKRAKRAVANGRFPPDIQNQLEDDMDETLPILHVFQQGSPVRDDLRDLVSAWTVYRSDEGLGYAPGITLLAAMFLLVSPPQEAFLSLCNLLARPCMHAFYTETQDEIDAFYRIFENLQADMFPRIYANCKNLGLKLPESYFRSVLVDQVPFDAACRLWDQIVLEGDGYIFRAALAIFAFLEPRLYYPDKDEIESVLEGRNAATMAIAEREKERARLRGEQYEEALDGKLSVFGLHEDALFDWLSNDGWRDSRFERLCMRELPD